MRIIPARAGFTAPGLSRFARHRDHPRSRGVYEGFSLDGSPDPGSSPLARGLRDRGPCGRACLRIIPARAGFTRSSPPGPGRSEDHPRSRGVYSRNQLATVSMVGSSPLARGLRDVGDDRWGAAGIIPARAGFTTWSRARTCIPTDHPRSRGVYVRMSKDEGADRGSSPLARGLHPAAQICLLHDGIIPARAGFTLRTPSSSLLTRDHPRSRGVYPDPRQGQDRKHRIIPARAGFTQNYGASPMTRHGSSPLARGLRQLPGQRVQGQGIIPARAGFTRSSPRPTAATRDHPRSRGVYAADPYLASYLPGSSPLARGLPTIIGNEEA